MNHKIAQLEADLMRAALEAAHIGLLVVDSHSQLVILNGAAEQMLGCNPRELVGRPYQLLLGTGMAVARFRELFATDAPELSCEGRVPHVGRGSSLILFHGKSFRAGDGELFRTVSMVDLADYGMTRDQFISVRRQLDNMNSAVVVTDARSADQPIVYVNAAFERMSGYPAREAVGRNCRFLQGNDREQPEIKEIRKAMEQHACCHVVLRNYRRDGVPFLNELLISPMFDEHGELTHHIGIQRVVSQRVAPSTEHN